MTRRWWFLFAVAMAETGVAGIVLAGGGSVRFGRDKLSEPVEGEPMLLRAIRALSPVCDPILVSVASQGSPLTLPEGLEATVVPDVLPDQGPLVGLWSALQEVSTPLAVVVGGDMPFLEVSVLRLLVSEGRSHPDVLVTALADGAAVRPLPCALRLSAREPLGGLIEAGERRLRALVSEFPSTVVPGAAWRALDPMGGSLRDVDRPEDLLDGDSTD